jgi:hypothetical protein
MAFKESSTFSAAQKKDIVSKQGETSVARKEFILPVFLFFY